MLDTHELPFPLKQLVMSSFGILRGPFLNIDIEIDGINPDCIRVFHTEKTVSKGSKVESRSTKTLDTFSGIESLFITLILEVSVFE